MRKQNTHANIEVGGTGAALTQKLFYGPQLLLALVFTIITGKVSSVNSLVSTLLFAFLFGLPRYIRNELNMLHVDHILIYKERKRERKGSVLV